MQITDPGFFSRGKVTLPPSPHVTPDSLAQDLQAAFGGQGCEVYKTALLGADVVLKRSAWTGVAIKINHSGAHSELRFNAFAPSVLVRLLAMGIIPILILHGGAWKRVLADFKAYLGQSRLLGGQLQGQPQVQGLGMGYGQPQPGQPQPGFAQAPQGQPPQGQPGGGQG